MEGQYVSVSSFDYICLSYPDRDTDHQAEEPRGPGPFYFFGGANGAALVCTYCESRGWRRIYNKHREDFRLKWCETKSPANYYNFRAGEQLVYQIPNNKVLTTKIGLLSSLREFERVSSKVNHGRLRRLKMEEFIPATFRMDMREEREAFFAQQEDVSNKESQMWICKPTGLNQGKGIFLLKSQEDVAALRLKLQELQDSRANRRGCFQPPQARIVQRYIQKPLLLKGRKFDVRSYLLIACTAPYMVFFRHGYVRLTCDLYDPSSSSLSAHLTNQYMQKKNPLYSLLKEDTVWSIESFNAYVNDKYRVAKGLPRDWVKGAFAKRMQQIMTQCFFAVKSKLDRRLGFFDLIGCDFMIDDEFNVWLLEMNCNPALHTNCEVLKEVIPRTVKETLDITLEIFNKCRCRQQILPLATQREFLLLHSGAFPPASVLPGGKNTLGGSTLKSTCHQKSTKKNPKTEGTICKSGNAGKLASVSSSDTSVDVLETATEYEEPSVQVPLNAVTCEMTEALGNSLSLPEPTRARTEHKTSKCALDRQRKNVDQLRHPEGQQKKRSIKSKSTAALSGRTQSSISHSISTKSGRLKPDATQSSRTSLQPKQVPLSPPHVGRPVWVDTHDKGNRPGEEELTEDTNGLAFDKKEEL
ncbi:protein polyglycylase TTLL10 [Myripristis murdjan]|uniref:protein polyglycylase TTLL10 n=1 Tax=Myripristis murdjan TaxID=586833 RepID=UPI0011764340|nr:inactive polyglycylase TTLL10 [Myripristis murdjan]